MRRLWNSLADLPEDLANALIAAYQEIRMNYLVERWEPSELNGGKFAEVVYRILEWEASGRTRFTPLGAHISNFGSKARRFASDTTLPEAIRFHVPQALEFLYTLRNKRGVGHAAGDIAPNHMDAAGVLAVAKWVLAEVVRLLNGVDSSEAKRTVEDITVKEMELVWEVGDKRRVLDPELGYREKTLLLLHREHPEPVSGRTLFEWVEYSRWSAYRDNILKRLHRERLIEFDEGDGTVTLSPKGIQEAEAVIIQARASG